MSNAYLDEFLRMRCAPDLLASRVLPSTNTAKEVTEVMAAVRAVRDHLGAASFGRRDVVLLDVGCGVAPRAAALFALLTRWWCFGVDPRVRRGAPGVHRVWGVRADAATVARRMAAGMLPLASGDARLGDVGLVVCVNVHGHAPLSGPGGYVPILGREGSAVAGTDTLVVAIPCCTPLDLPASPVADYEDPHVQSPARRVRVWRGTPRELTVPVTDRAEQ